MTRIRTSPPSAPTASPGPDRRRFLIAGAAGTLGLAACRDRSTTRVQASGAAAPAIPAAPMGSLGAPRRAYGERSAFEKPVRSFKADSPTPGTGSSRTPLQDQLGIITPSALHFERHHRGVPSIDPTKYELMITLRRRDRLPAADPRGVDRRARHDRRPRWIRPLQRDQNLDYRERRDGESCVGASRSSRCWARRRWRLPPR